MNKMQLDYMQQNLPCYYYDGAMISSQCNTLKEKLKGFNFLYSIKSNPFKPVVDTIASAGFGSDAASTREVFISLESGMEPSNIFFSSPGKTKADIELCFDKCVIIADSLYEIININQEATKRNTTAKIGIRINPDFSMDNDLAMSAKFGIDIEQADKLAETLEQCKNISVIGIHIHIKSQVLDFEKIGNYYHNCFNVAKRLNELSCVSIEFINFGSGIGAIYDTLSDKAVDLDKLYYIASDIVEENKNTFNAMLYIETGRFLVCNAGTYYTEIIDIKQSRGTKYLMVKNAMNGFLRPTISNILIKKANGGDVGSEEPFFTSKNAFDVSVVNSNEEKECVTVVGNLCTALDIVGENLMLNKAEIGDMIAITNAGSYAYSLSPLLFASHDAPKQVFSADSGVTFVK